MSRATAAAKKAGWTLLFAFLVAPAVAPVRDLLESAAELAGGPRLDWLAILLLLLVGFVLAETYDGPIALLLPTALLVAVLYVAVQWLVGLRGANAISLRLLAATGLGYLAALTGAIAIVFETDLRHRLAAYLGDETVDPDAE
ncbi:hypothetical protein HTZ84_03610 [Haloterrigena sp. SYSU A558-1]|uniref:Uncharacterized protein n=1 Tax=Haloterrigena gelatinilytica TaxID=2741724 RepID=A0ABX2LAP7_9EURY|nr:hypothetical protein [Haloterrigena gelatinilytica]NUC71403.1 hypothetical protein [Haloterrigena gelatinilytica]